MSPNKVDAVKEAKAEEENSEQMAKIEKAMEDVKPKSNCKHCYGRGYTGWDAPVIEKNKLPPNMRNLKGREKYGKMRGDKIICRCVINKAKKISEELAQSDKEVENNETTE